MARKCQISKKKALKANRVSHANNKTLCHLQVNLQRKWLYDSETGKTVHARVSTRILRTISKKGLSATLRDYGLTLDDLK